MNEGERGECKEEEGVASFESGIKIPSTMRSFFPQFRGVTVIGYIRYNQGPACGGRGRPEQGSDSALMTQTGALSPTTSIRLLGLGPLRQIAGDPGPAGHSQVSQGREELAMSY